MTGTAHLFERIQRLPFIAALVATLLLSWPAVINGGAFFFPDTGTYLREADTAFAQVTGWQSEWSDRRVLYAETPEVPQRPASATATSATVTPAAGPLHPVLLGRSIYYGLLIFPFLILFGSIGAVIVQAALGVLTIWLVLAAFGSERSRMPGRVLGITALLAGLTSLPFFVSLLMPDVFAGFAIVLAIAAVAGWDRLVRWERICLALLLVFSGMAHSSHILLLGALAGVVVLVQLCTGAKAKVALAAMLLAAACGLVGEQLFAAAVSHKLGEAPIRPPFLTARLINDGPGHKLLTQRCPGIGFEACRFLDRMPQDSDTFLWSQKPQEGVFSVEDHAVQRALARQDATFALDTLRNDPLGVALSSATSIARQITLTDLNIFNFSVAMGGTSTLGLPSPIADQVRVSRYANATMPVAFPRWANRITAVAAIIFLGLVLMGKTREKGAANLRIAAGLFLAGVLLNASVTGAMSKPHDRYNVRVMWVLQLAALAILATRRERTLVEQK